MLISPMEPGITPRNILPKSKYSGIAEPSLRMLSGVAMVSASMPFMKLGTAHLVMTEVHEKNINARPARAGLTKFLPMPPYSCLTTTIAKKVPTTGIHSGVPTGRHRTSRMPVTHAERSPREFGFFMSLR